MSEEIIAMLEELASRKSWCDHDSFVVDDWAGGNVDDAYSGGWDDGEAELARTILNMVKNDK